ncbi:MAG: response regulator [Lachnospiraceae bacterium]|nr:response regulator [Lachnospiraceae bacterium]
MNIFIVDNKKDTLNRVSGYIRDLQPDARVQCFRSSPEALAAARDEKVDVAFLGMTLSEMDGIIFGQYLKDLHPSVNLIYLTGRRGDAFDAMAVRASGCLLLPVTEESVGTELKELRNPPGQGEKKRVFAQTFGNFEFFVDGKPIAFKYTKTKEILALLVNNRGAQTTNGEIIASLWEDDGDPVKKTSYLCNLRQDLQNTLTRLKLTEIIIKQRGSMAIAADLIECDLYDWLEKKKQSRYQYLGDYMNQYSWGEFLHAELDEISYSLED